jgi:histidinol phosphatase-like PHP family hydrolase
MKSNIFEGKYLFHIHTDFTDGKLSVKDYFEFAKKTKIDKIIFLEHIRKTPSYNVQEYIDQIKYYSSKYNVPSNIGFEAKLLQDGDLDIQNCHFELAEIIGIAEHGFPDNKNLYYKALNKVFDFLGTLSREKLIVWVHPGLWLKKKDESLITSSFYFDLIKYALDKNIFIEHNLRYNLIPNELFTCISSKEKIVYGLDAHCLNDLNRFFERIK